MRVNTEKKRNRVPNEKMGIATKNQTGQKWQQLQNQGSGSRKDKTANLSTFLAGFIVYIWL